MSLIKSVSGIRGTIGGDPGENLTPVDIISFASAYAAWLKSRHDKPNVIIGRDGRVTGAHVATLVTEALRASGVSVVDTGLSTTPTVEMAVISNKAQGGIIVTASHNPAEWNALKFLNERGEFIGQEDGEALLRTSKAQAFAFVSYDAFGTLTEEKDSIADHVRRILALDLVQEKSIRSKQFHVVVDCVNSTGAIALPALLDALGCTYSLLNSEVTGLFAHNPEPLEEHLSDLCAKVKSDKAVLGIAVDPDVDRLALVDEHGNYFGEEYTLVAVADYILQKTPGPCVSNLSSSQALRDIAQQYGQSWSAAKVGEVHVVEEMKRVNAVIGGEGNGGIIYPDLHYGRDALVGIALLLSYLAESGKSLSELKSGYPQYTIAKDKISLAAGGNTAALLQKVAAAYPDMQVDDRDGVKLIADTHWIHLRASNTEPVIRIYAESRTREEATALAQEARKKLENGL